MVMSYVFWLTVLIWLIYCRICYTHFYKMRHSELIAKLVSPFVDFNKMTVYEKVGFVLSMTHALISLFGSLYLLSQYDKTEIYNTYLYHIIIAVSLSHYTTDMLIVAYYHVQVMFIIHHIVSIIMITTFYVGGQLSTDTYPFSMVFMEITNPFQIIFSYLSSTHQTHKKRFFVISTIFTFMFTFVRCLLLPFIYLDVQKSIYKDVKVNGFHAVLCEICGITGSLGSLIWNYSLLKGYYNKVYLPLTKK